MVEKFDHLGDTRGPGDCGRALVAPGSERGCRSLMSDSRAARVRTSSNSPARPTAYLRYALRILTGVVSLCFSAGIIQNFVTTSTPALTLPNTAKP